ncbi:hypothetical protein EIP86_005624 [Pleurotus ostreatoroseus]|nr:hypothetical protein EIP86_005624 [Pleurotus ostreatoroseus]
MFTQNVPAILRGVHCTVQGGAMSGRLPSTLASQTRWSPSSARSPDTSINLVLQVAAYPTAIPFFPPHAASQNRASAPAAPRRRPYQPPARVPAPRRTLATPIPSPNIVVSQPSPSAGDALGEHDFSRRLSISPVSPRRVEHSILHAQQGCLYNPTPTASVPGPSSPSPMPCPTK